mmetsp:Transcript_25254/g.64181  ORF Transcript_25254/g.64181 Transcript_25254/m.64181 type:complete len:321 (-) Transcript_25254:1725-2687(-)
MPPCAALLPPTSSCSDWLSMPSKSARPLPPAPAPPPAATAPLLPAAAPVDPARFMWCMWPDAVRECARRWCAAAMISWLWPSAALTAARMSACVSGMDSAACSTPCSSRRPHCRGATLRVVSSASKSPSGSSSGAHSSMMASATRIITLSSPSCAITSMSCAQKVGGKGVAYTVINHWLAYSTGGMPFSTRCSCSAGCRAASSASKPASSALSPSSPGVYSRRRLGPSGSIMRQYSLKAGSSGRYMSMTPAANAMPWQYPTSRSCRLYALSSRNSERWPASIPNSGCSGKVRWMSRVMMSSISSWPAVISLSVAKRQSGG